MSSALANLLLGVFCRLDEMKMAGPRGVTAIAGPRSPERNLFEGRWREDRTSGTRSGTRRRRSRGIGHVSPTQSL